MIEDTVKKEIERVAGEVIPEKRKLRKVKGLMTDITPSPFKRFKDVFFEEDFGTVKDSVIQDIIVPTMKNLFADIFIGSIERAIFGSTKRPSRSGYTDYSSGLVRTHTASGTNYSALSSAKQKAEEPAQKNKISIDELIYPDRASAQDLADVINGEIADHGSISVSELYEIITPDNEAPPINYTDTYYGWNQPDCAYVKPHGRYFRVVLPKYVQL